jgi:hypothetical protein
MKNITRPVITVCIALLAAMHVHADQTFTLLQELPAITHIDVGASGASHGDIMAFEARFSTEDGVQGVMSGMITTVTIQDTEGHAFVDRMGSIEFDFGGLDSILIAGTSRYAMGQAEMNIDTPQVRAVTGGTGRFIGARGQVTTTRKDAGHYEHIVQLID